MMGTSLLDQNEMKALRAEITWLRDQGHEVRLGVAAKDAEICRLRAALEWKPIDTAPQDGTHILIYVPEWGMYVARWEPDFSRPAYRAGRNPQTGEIIIVPAVHGAWVAGGDLSNDETLEFYRPRGPYPTYWRPLPPPPPMPDAT